MVPVAERERPILALLILVGLFATSALFRPRETSRPVDEAPLPITARAHVFWTPTLTAAAASRSSRVDAGREAPLARTSLTRTARTSATGAASPGMVTEASFVSEAAPTHFGESRALHVAREAPPVLASTPIGGLTPLSFAEPALLDTRSRWSTGLGLAADAATGAAAVTGRAFHTTGRALVRVIRVTGERITRDSRRDRRLRV
jgi:hypothetical protein